ncbi:conserved hypothetical protein [Perkinsus marinus ATCC 50983]|uniref:Mitochondrial-processing peptidase subunit alpha n=1 Tax=Perkinsus marinus (strain ATCC 50983 / TXsc) TaxID=423536 RepID=C5KS02_PERM5|nr:conserved hypothetical protein [Perkinsus marinus ATCC 50983]EER12693.1 conserved hypothetical protein [Perkinsus marinus ATCC 50983]|eukprot:XP_002780898.1 conserved hypothetical protein [Perkinsus marinus ATCC 50983]
MLSRLLPVSPSSTTLLLGSGSKLARCLGPALSRCFSAQPGAAVAKTEGKSTIQGTSYNVVKFQQEDVSEVVKEVPHFQFYYIGGEHKDNKYRDVPLDIPVLTEAPVSPPQLKKPEMKFSVLENGMRIVSVDKQGLTSNLGLFVHAGSRFETPAEEGLSHMVECVAFRSTAHLSHLRTIKTIEVLGMNGGCQAGREHIMYNLELLREYMPVASTLVVGNVLFPRLLPWEVNACHKEIKKAHERLKADTDQYVSELLHQTAYHNNTLGNALLANEGRALEHFTGDNIREFMMKHFSAERSVFVGINVDHDELCKWLMRSFAEYVAIPNLPREEAKPVYTGGYKLEENADMPVCNIAIGFETEGWNSADLVPVTVLQTLLGGGGSFSTGGPGKGMHSRLYLNVLNQNPNVESCMAFNTQYSDSGLFGMYITGFGQEAPRLVDIALNELRKLDSFTPDEVSRAKNTLKGNIFMNAENSKVLMEDIGRQIIMSGKVVTPEEFATRVDAVTEADLKKVAAKLLRKNPTYVVYGDTKSAPHYEYVRTALASLSAAKGK